MRLRMNERLSFRSYARLIASMYAFMAPVVDQTASTKPNTVMRTLDAGCASRFLSELPSSSVA